MSGQWKANQGHQLLYTNSFWSVFIYTIICCHIVFKKCTDPHFFHYKLQNYCIMLFFFFFHQLPIVVIHGLSLQFSVAPQSSVTLPFYFLAIANMWTLSPHILEAQHDIEKLESWVYQIENYFVLANVQNKKSKARYTTLLLIKSAAIWLCIRGYDLQTFTQ